MPNPPLFCVEFYRNWEGVPFGSFRGQRVCTPEQVPTRIEEHEESGVTFGGTYGIATSAMILGAFVPHRQCINHCCFPSQPEGAAAFLGVVESGEPFRRRVRRLGP
jgi:hypothetical protein